MYSYSINKSNTQVDKIIIYFFLFIIFLGVCYGTGKTWAKEKESFYKFKHNNKSYALIIIYGNNLIGASFDSNNIKIISVHDKK